MYFRMKNGSFYGEIVSQWIQIFLGTVMAAEYKLEFGLEKKDPDS